MSQCCGSAGVAQFFLDLYTVTNDAKYLSFAEKMTADLLARATRDVTGTRWVQAEHRVQPDLLVAQTGYMQGAAGIGMWLLHLDGAQRRRPPFVQFPIRRGVRPAPTSAVSRRQPAREGGALLRPGIAREILDRPRQAPGPVLVADEGGRVDAIRHPKTSWIGRSARCPIATR